MLFHLKCLSGVSGDFTYLKSSDTHEKNGNISCQPKNSSSYTSLLLKLTDMTSNQEYVYMKTSAQIPGLTSLPLTLTAKKSSKIKFSADKIYYNFSHEHPKI